MQEDEIRKLVRQAVQKAVGTTGSSSGPLSRRHALTGRAVITEADLQDAAPGSEVAIPGNALVTPLARDLARERSLKLVAEVSASSPKSASSAPNLTTSQHAASPDKTVALGADHGGLELKENLKPYLQEMGYAVLDCGASTSQSVDYPDFAYAVAKLVAEGRAAYGIMVDGAGIGSCMAANKVPGVRAALCYDLSTAINSREHNDANVLTLGGRLIGVNLARGIVKTWLSTSFGGGRHARRVDKIMAIERRYAKK
jgi:ribose 5-phosphate isomerase B